MKNLKSIIDSFLYNERIMSMPKYYKLSISEDYLSCHKYRKQFYDIFVDGTYIGVRQHDGVPWHFT